MKTAILLFLLVPNSISAAPHTLSQRLAELIPEGYSEGSTEKGERCGVLFHYAKEQYARAVVMAEPSGDLVEVELFLGLSKTSSKWGSTHAQVQSAKLALSATRTRQGILVRAENKAQRSIASCILKTQKSLALEMNR